MKDIDRPRRLLAISLAALAGYVDAVGFLSADSYFVSFMSGNTTRLGVDLVSQPHRAVIPALLILGFVLGVTGGAVLAIRAGYWRKPVVVGLVATLLLGAAALREMGAVEPAVALMVLAMGTLNNTFQRQGEVSVGLTYMTGALVKFGQGLGAALCGVARPGWWGYGLLWLGLALGAIGGAFAFVRLGSLALWLAGSWALLSTLAAWWLTRREPVQPSI